MRKKLFFVLSVLLFLGTSCNEKEVKVETSPIKIKTITVNDNGTQLPRTYVGTIESEQSIPMVFPLGGEIKEIYVHNGQKVKKGQLIAKVDETTAKSLHESALATLHQAEDGYERLKTVHEGGGISDVRWVQMETDLEKARQAEISAKDHLDKCALHALMDGVITSMDWTIGQTLRPTEVFAMLIDMNCLRVKFSVPEKEVCNIQPGDLATATVPALNDCQLNLKISDKNMNANPMGHTYKVNGSITGGSCIESLLPGMVAKVQTISSGISGIVIPSECVMTRENGLCVWVNDDGKAHRRTIEVGDYVKNGVMVSNGLANGDRVITQGYHKLYEGASVVE